MAGKRSTYAELDSFLVGQDYSHSNRFKLDQSFLSSGAVVSFCFFDTAKQPIETRTYTLVEGMQFDENSRLLNRPRALLEGQEVVIDPNLMKRVFGFKVISSPLEAHAHEGHSLAKWESRPPWYH